MQVIREPVPVSEPRSTKNLVHGFSQRQHRKSVEKGSGAPLTPPSSPPSKPSTPTCKT